ncbi:TRAP transporter large permease [uncultured Sphaerochaeta sp.]|uniref:TRAP transporter large permease n=1 Tax=uncultured Sphaerochaeta sp. TaxID=886478 RepID=UPI002A0A993A|nr:TRAP transporter large permease [uncultured Sphaerochaeta sp.]
MTLLIISLLLLITLGLPIGYALGVSGGLYFIAYHPELIIIIPERLFSGMNAPLLLSLPLFILMGLFMNEGNLTQRLINMLMMFVGKIRGSLGLVNVLVSMVFGGISGSSVSDTASVGAILIPEMEKKGYSQEFACGVTVASSTMGMIIPPSIPMLMYATISSESVGRLFLGGLVPGVMIGIFMLVITFLIARKENIPIEKVSCDPAFIRKTLKDGFFAIIMPLFVVGSIVFGVATATEAAGLGALYALVVGLFIFKSLKLKRIPALLVETIKLSASVMIVIAFSNMFTWILSLEHVPLRMAMFITSINLPPVIVLLVIDVIILFVGMFLDVSPAIMLLTPVFLPAVSALGVSPVQFGVLLIAGLAIGLDTPPVGMCLNVASTIAKVDILHIFKSAIPFLLANVATLLLVTIFPAISNWLPNLCTA